MQMIHAIRDLAELYGVSGSDEAELERALNRAVYKYTDCGAWLERVYGGIAIGTIVEGSDAEFSRELYYPFTLKDFNQAIAYLEESAHEAWMEANTDEG